VAAQAEDLSQALRELLEDDPIDPEPPAGGPLPTVPVNALVGDPQNDTIAEQKPLADPALNNGAALELLDETELDDIETSQRAALESDAIATAGNDDTTATDNAGRDELLDMSLGLPPLDDVLDLDQLDQLDPFDLDLTPSDSDQLDPADLELEPVPLQEEVLEPRALDQGASGHGAPLVPPAALADSADDTEADAELTIADAAPHYVYPGMATASESTLAVPAAATPSELMQLFADEASDPRVLNVLQQIQGLLQQQAPPTVMAGAYRALGNLFRDRIEKGELSPQTLQRAMAAYQQVLHWTPETSPMRAEVLNDMGNLSWLLSRCSQGPENSLPHLHQSIQSYQQALTQIAPDTHPQTYPMIQNNLGAAYGDLARYQNPPENLQKSIQAYQEALRYRSAEQDPMRYASTQNNLGTTYWNLAQHQEPIHHLKAAIAAYDSALSYYKPEQDALNYAMIQNNLGTAYWNLAQHEHSEEWLRQAINAYQLALEYRTLEAAPAAFAATQNNLATAHWHVANYIDEVPKTRFNSLQQAMRAYEAALQAVDYLQQSDRPTALNFDVTATQNNLGLVLYQTATDRQFDTAELSETYLNTALEHHLAALNGWQGRPELRQTALNCVIQTLQAIYSAKGLVGQNLALSKVPGQLLPEILPKL
ncbi:MAG: tetratricopeptide repeat protein, partial [Elainellaceae cyanobacterium]